MDFSAKILKNIKGWLLCWCPKLLVQLRKIELLGNGQLFSELLGSQFLIRPVWRKNSTWCNKLSIIQKYKLKEPHKAEITRRWTIIFRIAQQSGLLRPLCWKHCLTLVPKQIHPSKSSILLKIVSISMTRSYFGRHKSSQASTRLTGQAGPESLKQFLALIPTLSFPLS